MALRSYELAPPNPTCVVQTREKSDRKRGNSFDASAARTVVAVGVVVVGVDGAVVAAVVAGAGVRAFVDAVVAGVDDTAERPPPHAAASSVAPIIRAKRERRMASTQSVEPVRDDDLARDDHLRPSVTGGLG